MNLLLIQVSGNCWNGCWKKGTFPESNYQLQLFSSLEVMKKIIHLQWHVQIWLHWQHLMRLCHVTAQPQKPVQQQMLFTQHSVLCHHPECLSFHHTENSVRWKCAWNPPCSHNILSQVHLLHRTYIARIT